MRHLRRLFLGALALCTLWRAAAQPGLPESWWAPVIGNPGPNGPVNAIATSTNGIYVAGSFTHAGSANSRKIAFWNGTTWSAVGGGGIGTDSEFARAVAHSSGNLYVGGLLSTAYGADGSLFFVTNIAAWNGSMWSDMRGGVNGLVTCIAVTGSHLYVGGGFTRAGGVSTAGIARWDGTNWSSVGGGVNGSVNALAVQGNDLFAGGAFSQAGGVSARNVARWNGTNWSPLGVGLDNTVNALAVTSNELYVSGNFNAVGRWNGSNWAFPDLVGLNLGTPPVALAAGRILYLGSDRLSQWEPCGRGANVGSGVTGRVHALALSGNSLYVGGQFSSSGPSANIAHWRAANLPKLWLYDAYSRTFNSWFAVGSGATNARVVVMVCPLPEEPITIEYSTSNITATAGIHYAAVSGVLTFSNSGPSLQEIDVPVFGSPLYFSPVRRFALQLSTTNALVHSGLIAYYDLYSGLPVPTASIDNVSSPEGNVGITPLNFTVSLSAAFAEPFNVGLQFQNDTAIANIDYLPTPTNIVIPSGAVSQSFSVPVLGNTLKEFDKRFIVKLWGGNRQGIGTILNDDTVPGLAQIPLAFSISESDSRVTGAAPVRLTAPIDRTVTVDFATADGTAKTGIDYLGTSGRLVFPPGSTNQFVRVPILGDIFSEPHKQFFVNYSNSTEATLTQTQGVWTIVNDDHLSVPAGFSASVFATGLTNPTRMAFAPDGRLFVCEQSGTIWIFRDGVRVPGPFLSLSNKVPVRSEGGLLGLAFDPGFETNQFIYVYYSTTVGFSHNRVSRFTANGDVATPDSETVIHALDPSPNLNIHNAGDIHFGPDGKLYVSVGENGRSTNSQTLNTRLGKLLRINADGTIPDDNPFYNTAIGNNRAVWALGLRNPFAFAFQPGTGRMFINDVSLAFQEEINEGAAGANYGWPLAEGYSTNASFRNPLFVYPNSNIINVSCAITAGTFYNPPRAHFPAPYVGNYMFTDFCVGAIWRLILTNGVTVTNFIGGINSAVDLKVAADGSLYCLCYNYRDYFGSARGGRIFRIYVPGPPSQFESIRWLNTGAIELGISAEAGRLYSLESSTDLITWQRLRNLVAPSSSFVTQEPSSQTGQRFYRLVE